MATKKGEGDTVETVKLNKFANTFKSGSFTVAKDVTGNMANETDQFEIAVTLTSAKPIGTTVTLAGTEVAPSSWTKTEGKEEWTYTATLNYSEAGGAKTFSNIPTGVVATVAENTSTEKMNGYTYVSTKIGSENFTSLSIADDTNAAIVVTNDNSTSVETGITMDSVPYILLLAVACVGLVLFFVKKRSAREY
ncbi:MAG: DUF5979 domain-containing protein [Eubacteriales bacterium]|nr:DUF5979 domain-containing protein [Eubacteriales bacterium]